MGQDRSTREVSEVLNISQDRVAELLRTGAIKGYRTNVGPQAHWRVTQAELDRFRNIDAGGTDDAQ